MTQIAYIHRELWQDSWRIEAERMFGQMQAEGVLPEREPLSGGEDAVFAMAVDGRTWRPIGMAVHYQPEGWDALWLDLLYVEPGFRKRGIARRLIDEVAARADILDLPRIELGTTWENRPMQNLAIATGFDNTRVDFARPVTLSASSMQGGVA
jgi:GNAT superfamily N-acetyltransferase